jgi:hypothetical protein
MEFFRVPMGVPGMLKRLLGKFVTGKMISLAVSGGRRTVGVRRKVMKFRNSIVPALGHIVLLRIRCDWRGTGGCTIRWVFDRNGRFQEYHAFSRNYAGDSR